MATLRVALGALLLTCLLSAPRAAVGANCWIGVDYSVNKFSPKSVKLDVNTSMDIILSKDIGGIKIYELDDNGDVLRKLKGKNVEVILGVQPNELIIDFAKDPAVAQKWLDKNIVPYVKDVNIVDLAVANEKMQTETGAIVDSIAQGMWNLYYALQKRGLEKKIKVTTPQHPGFLATPWPPSAAHAPAAFAPKWAKVLDFLKKTGSTISITAYPFFAVRGGWGDYDVAVFKKNNKGFNDGKLRYENQLDQIVDGFLSAAAKLGYGDLPIMIAETGWPTEDDKAASEQKAADYYDGLLKHICSGKGTPLRPNTFIKTYLFEPFDETWKETKTAPFEAHFGWMTWDGKPKFNLDLKPLAAASTATVNKGVDAPLKWCVVRKNADQAVVKGVVNWACSKGGVDCNSYKIKSCGNRAQHAVYNAIFQKNGQSAQACAHAGTGKITTRNPFNPKRPRCVLPGRPGA